MSRLNGPTLTLKKPRDLDRAILAARLIKKSHPGVYFAEEGVLRALADDDAGAWSPRSIEYVAAALKPTGVCVTLKDLGRVRELCSRLRVSVKGKGSKQIRIDD